MTIAVGKQRTPLRISVYFMGMVALCFALGLAEEISLGLFFAALHELGHLGAMAAFRARPQRVCLAAAGVRIECPPGLSLSFGKEIVIAFAGPAVSLALAGLFAAAHRAFEAPLLHDCAMINLGFALINLMPVRQLDGGRALYYALCRRLSESVADGICFAASLLCLFVIAAATAFICLTQGIHWPLIVAVIYLAGNC